MSYLESQLSRLEPKEPFYPSIIIFDGKGNKTNQLNITIEQLAQIKLFLLESI